MFNPEAVPLLSKVAEALRKLPDQPVRLEGHTDNVPIETERFPSNWELSAARANAVLELLCGRLELDPRRFAVAGYADYHPVADNSTSEGRGHNRRVDIVVLSRSAAEMEPRQQPDDNRASR
jgi:chemotaxis protein MotB